MTPWPRWSASGSEHPRIPASGPVAWRSRARWHDGATGHPIDRPDLGTVERGLAGMRRTTDDEHRLIEASRKARDQQERAEARNNLVRRVALMAFACLFLILAGVTVWAWRAQTAATRETAEVLTQSGINALEHGHSFDAMHLFAKAVLTLSSDSMAQADNRLRLSFLGPGHVPALRSILGHAGAIFSAAFSPEGSRVVRPHGTRRARPMANRSPAEGARGRGELRRVQPGRVAGRHRLGR